MQKHPIWGNEMTLPCFFGGDFYFIILTKTLKKNHGQHSIWENKTALSKTCCLSVFFSAFNLPKR